MRFIEDDEVANLLSLPEATEALQEAFSAYGEGQASNLTRERTYCRGSSLSTMGAVLPYGGVMGAKVYPTIQGRFNFCITLFSSESGNLLAVIQGNALTALRTSATTLLAARHLANKNSTTMTLFGSGQQAAAHARALLSNFGLRKVHIIDPHGEPNRLALSLSEQYGVEAIATNLVSEALSEADIIVTATRSSTPLFDGSAIKPGTFVAAIDSSKPDTREIDDALLSRCACIVVEDRTQALMETGDFVLAAADAFSEDQIVDLGFLVCAQSAAYERRPQDILTSAQNSAVLR